jgi:hypothetical protein
MSNGNTKNNPPNPDRLTPQDLEGVGESTTGEKIGSVWYWTRMATFASLLAAAGTAGVAGGYKGLEGANVLRRMQDLAQKSPEDLKRERQEALNRDVESATKDADADTQRRLKDANPTNLNESQVDAKLAEFLRGDKDDAKRIAADLGTFLEYDALKSAMVVQKRIGLLNKTNPEQLPQLFEESRKNATIEAWAKWLSEPKTMEPAAKAVFFEIAQEINKGDLTLGRAAHVMALWESMNGPPHAELMYVGLKAHGLRQDEATRKALLRCEQLYQHKQISNQFKRVDDFRFNDAAARTIQSLSAEHEGAVKSLRRAKLKTPPTAEAAKVKDQVKRLDTYRQSSTVLEVLGKRIRDCIRNDNAAQRDLLRAALEDARKTVEPQSALRDINEAGDDLGKLQVAASRAIAETSWRFNATTHSPVESIAEAEVTLRRLFWASNKKMRINADLAIRDAEAFVKRHAEDKSSDVRQAAESVRQCLDLARKGHVSKEDGNRLLQQVQGGKMTAGVVLAGTIQHWSQQLAESYKDREGIQNPTRQEELKKCRTECTEAASRNILTLLQLFREEARDFSGSSAATIGIVPGTEGRPQDIAMTPRGGEGLIESHDKLLKEAAIEMDEAMTRIGDQIKEGQTKFTRFDRMAKMVNMAVRLRAAIVNLAGIQIGADQNTLMISDAFKQYDTRPLDRLAAAFNVATSLETATRGMHERMIEARAKMTPDDINRSIASLGLNSHTDIANLLQDRGDRLTPEEAIAAHVALQYLIIETIGQVDAQERALLIRLKHTGNERTGVAGNTVNPYETAFWLFAKSLGLLGGAVLGAWAANKWVKPDGMKRRVAVVEQDTRGVRPLAVKTAKSQMQTDAKTDSMQAQLAAIGQKLQADGEWQEAVNDILALHGQMTMAMLVDNADQARAMQRQIDPMIAGLQRELDDESLSPEDRRNKVAKLQMLQMAISHLQAVVDGPADLRRARTRREAAEKAEPERDAQLHWTLRRLAVSVQFPDPTNPNARAEAIAHTRQLFTTHKLDATQNGRLNAMIMEVIRTSDPMQSSGLPDAERLRLAEAAEAGIHALFLETKPDQE